MFGGTAKTYANWKQLCAPYKEDKVWYIDVESPAGAQRTVRWYCDKKHADLMPKAEEDKPYYTVFLFENENDYIYCVKEKDLTEEQKEECELGDWRNAQFFGGIWYRKTAPEGQRFNGFLCSWPMLVEEACNTLKREKAAKDNEDTFL